MVLLVSTMAVFWPARHHDFLVLDDSLYISTNAMVTKGLTAGGMRWAMTTFHAGNWHPLTWVSHMLDVQFFGLAPGGHHLVSVLTHALNSALLFLTLRMMTGAVGQSAVVAVLFSLHPLRVESVAWVAERKDVLCAFFWMLTLAAYCHWARRPSSWRYLVVLAGFVLGLLSKSMIITLPFVLLLLDFWPLGRLRLPPRARNGGTSSSLLLPFSRLVLEKTPFLILSVTIGVVTLIAQQSGGAVGSVAHYPLPLRLANGLIAYARYILKTLWPQGLMMLYPYPDHGVQATTLVLSGILLAALTCLCVWGAARHPYLAIGWLWYLGTLVPVIGIIQVGLQSMADRYTYIPHIGFFVASVWGVQALSRNWSGTWKRHLGGGAVLALVALVLTTRSQLGTWRTNTTLFQHAVKIYPNNWMTRTELGLFLTEEGKVHEGIEQYRASLRANPGYVYTHYNLGVALYSVGRVDDAAESYQTAIRLSPNFAEPHHNLGAILMERGRLTEAATHFTEALRAKRDYAEAYHGLGIVFLRQGRAGDAVRYLERAFQLQPWNVKFRNDLVRARSQTLENR